MSEDEDSYRIIPSEEEVRREAVNKMVECSILGERVAEMEVDINNLRYLLKLLDEVTVDKDEDVRIDPRPVYRRIRSEIMSLMCQQMDMEVRIESLRDEIDNTEGMSNVKVIVKKL